MPTQCCHLMKTQRCVRIVFIALTAILFSAMPLKTQQLAPTNWSAFKFLMGEWVGEGTGMPGEGTGGFTFTLDLQNTILVRKNYADYPATKERPAFRHDDLMIVYQEGGKTKATYYDNEQHVINYIVTVSSDSNAVTFVSEPSPSAPRFRLTNKKAGTDKISIIFEIAPPGKPDAFSRYIEASARRKRSGPH